MRTTITPSWQVLTVVTVEFEHPAQELLIVGAVMSVIQSSIPLVYAEFLQASAEGQHEAEIIAADPLALGTHQVPSAV